MDVLCEGATGKVTRIAQPLTAHTSHTHGTGCTLASRIAAELSRGAAVPDAVAAAKRYVAGAIAHSAHLNLGTPGGQGPMNHHWEVADW